MPNFRIVDNALVGFNANDLYNDETPVEFEENAPWIVVVGASEVHQVPTAGLPRRDITGRCGDPCHHIDVFSATNEDGTAAACTDTCSGTAPFTYVTVSVSKTYSSPLPTAMMLGITTLSGSAIMRAN